MHLTRLFRTASFRLAATYAALFSLSALVLFSVIYWIATDALRQQLYSSVEAAAAELVADHKLEGIEETAEDISENLLPSRGQKNFYLLLDSQGRKIAGNLDPVPPYTGWRQITLDSAPDAFSEGMDRDGEERILFAFGTEIDDGTFLIVAEDGYRIRELEETIIRAFGWAFGLTILISSASGVAISFGFLRRIDAINRTSQAIIDGRLMDRVPIQGNKDELDSLAENINKMLDRIEALMESLRQVTNDIAHDLRTPLTRLRQRLEGARAKSSSAEAYENAIDQAIDDTDTILKTFTALLRIAQIEGGSRRAAFRKLDLSEMFQLVVNTYGAVAEDQGQTLTANIDDGIVIRGDRELLTQMLANLIENAIRHTSKDTEIRITLEQTASGPLGIIADNGPGIPEDMREKVFQRFFRMEQSRSTQGSGLGMSLIAAIAEVHDLSITLADNDHGLVVQLHFLPETSE